MSSAFEAIPAREQSNLNDLSGSNPGGFMRLPLAIALALALTSALASAAAADTASNFRSAVDQIVAQPYQPDYVPQGYDSAFGGANVLNTAAAQDYTTGSIPGSPDAPEWPAWFHQVQFTSADGAPLLGQLATHPGSAPGVVVVHGFNTHGYASVIRWAAMLYANGYNVLAADQRDFSFENDAGLGYPSWQQTFGWKESEDVVAAGRYLAAQRGTKDIGLVGYSEGGQNTVLALALDAGRMFKAAIQFSGPADQDTQIYSTAVPAGCATPLCTYPLPTRSCSSSCHRTTTLMSASRCSGPGRSTARTASASSRTRRRTTRNRRRRCRCSTSTPRTTRSCRRSRRR